MPSRFWTWWPISWSDDIGVGEVSRAPNRCVNSLKKLVSRYAASCGQ
jgi:hypothetical protein